ncbi:MAG TPA: hypothetical protein VFQ85_10790 [Mycobacteriales bacterium]|jgi:quinol monooxygenase YgiN|nr:hypothetical protein [Mycobacteriales bacterium]
MGFVQIIDYVTTRYDEVEALSEKFRANREGSGTAGPGRVTVGKDRDRENHFLVIAEFESYEAAMANSNDPVTQEFAAAMGELCDGPPTFYNLDLVRTDSFA